MINEQTHEGMTDVQAPYVINENTLIYISTDGVGYSVKLSELFGDLTASGLGGVDIRRLNILRPKFEVDENTHLELIISEHSDYSDPIYNLNTNNESTREICRVFNGSNWILFPSTGLNNNFENKAVLFYLNDIEQNKVYYCKYRWYGTNKVSQNWYGFTAPGYTPDITKDIEPYDKYLTITGPDELWEGETGQYTCTVTKSDGTSRSITPNWSAKLSEISSSGLLTAAEVEQDSTELVTATFNGLTATKSTIIKNDACTGLVITGPSKVQMKTAQPVVMTATATFRRGGSRDVTLSCNWTSSSTSIDKGKVTWAPRRSTIITNISASYSGQSANHELTIEYVGLIGIEIVGPEQVLMPTGSQQYSVNGIYTDGSRRAISSEILTSNSKTSISNNVLSWDTTEEEDITTGLSTTYIDPEYPDDEPYTASKNVLIIYMGVKEIRVDAPNEVLSTAGNYSYRVVAILMDNSEIDITSTATTNSSSSLLIHNKPSLSWDPDDIEENITNTISATYKIKPDAQKSFSASKSTLIKYMGVKSIKIVGSTRVCMDNGSSSYRVVAVLMDNSEIDITSEATLTTSNSKTTLSSGVLSWNKDTEEYDIITTLSASYKTKPTSEKTFTATLGVTIWWNGIISLVINGASTVPIKQGSSTYSVVGTKVDGTTRNITSQCTYTSTGATSISTSATLSWDPNGTQDITSTITAKYKQFDGATRIIKGSKTVLIDYVKIVKIEILGGTQIESNSSLTLTCRATKDDGTTELVHPNWSISGGVATINQSGLVSVGEIQQESTDTVTAVFTNVDGTFRDTHNIKEIKKYYAILRGSVIGEGISGSFISSKIDNLQKGTQTLTFIINKSYSEGFPMGFTFSIEGGSIADTTGTAKFKTSAGIGWSSEFGYVDGRYLLFDFNAANQLVSITLSVRVE